MILLDKWILTHLHRNLRFFIWWMKNLILLILQTNLFVERTLDQENGFFLVFWHFLSKFRCTLMHEMFRLEPSRFSCCVLLYFSLVFVIEHNWQSCWVEYSNQLLEARPDLFCCCCRIGCLPRQRMYVPPCKGEIWIAVGGQIVYKTKNNNKKTTTFFPTM